MRRRVSRRRRPRRSRGPRYSRPVHSPRPARNSEGTGSRGRGAALRIRLADSEVGCALHREHERGRNADRSGAEHDASRGRQRAREKPRPLVDGVIRDRDRLGQGRMHAAQMVGYRNEIGSGTRTYCAKAPGHGGIETSWRVGERCGAPRDTKGQSGSTTKGLMVTRSPARGPLATTPAASWPRMSGAGRRASWP